METLIDEVVGNFLGAISAGTVAMQPYGLALLFVLGMFAYHTRQWPTIMSSGAGLGESLAQFLLLMLGIGLTQWILVNVVLLTDGLFQTAADIGLAASGAGISTDDLRNPSFLLRMHKIVTKPLEDYILANTGWSAIWNAPTLWTFWLAELVIYATFVGVALHMALIMIEFHLSMLAAAVLLPCVVFTPSTFLGEWVVGWVLGCTTRVFLVTAVAGIGIPLFQGLAIAPTGVNATMIEALGVVAGSVLFGLVSWYVPSRAGHLVGSGLGLSGSLVAATAAGSMRAVLLASSAVQAASRVLSPMLSRR